MMRISVGFKFFFHLFPHTQHKAKPELILLQIHNISMANEHSLFMWASFYRPHFVSFLIVHIAQVKETEKRRKTTAK